MQLNLVADPGTAATPLRLGMRARQAALIEQLRAMGELGVTHVSFSLRPGDRPVDEVLQELAHEVLPHFTTTPEPALTSRGT
ncbi:hypothetical protein ACWEV3_39725 [Saccharopolyspora sp. NPDC003752]